MDPLVFVQGDGHIFVALPCAAGPYMASCSAVHWHNGQEAVWDLLKGNRRHNQSSDPYATAYLTLR